ncbi:MAG: A/G-specific adenine glycosylase [Phycisphaeraceae bacterium]|nr:A/G-specific adenine glycosylase [Phycisphaeraceae bacterium]
MSDRAIARAVEKWFAAHRRDLPWRVEVKHDRGTRDPYYALVSEVMLQQTQAARVADRFERFIDRFPTVDALASAPEDAVLAEWTGLGYYRRARSLHAAARAIVETHAGRTPDDPASLQSLPGVGRYTAGAIASVCFGVRTPIVDANIVRVALRLEGKKFAPSDPRAVALSWDRAESLVRAASSPGAFNEGLMELGALVCTPRNPACLACPLKKHCRAFAESTQDEIPLRAARKPRPEVVHAAVVLTDGDSRFLVTRRPAKGLWANLWQAPTLESPTSPDAPALRDFLRDSLALPRKSVPPRSLARDGGFTRVTSSRTVHFEVWRARVPLPSPPPANALVATREALLAGDPPLAVPHRRIVLGEGA